MSETNTASPYMTTRELAALIRKTPAAVRQMRYRGEGPAGIRIGREVIYERGVVQSWLEAKAATDRLAQRAA
jgi:hypothetical protein